MAEAHDKLEGIESVSKLGKGGSQQTEIIEHIKEMDTRDKFDSAMSKSNNTFEHPGVVQKIEEEAVKKPSLIDAVQEMQNRTDNLSKVSPDKLVAQAQEVITKIEDVKKTLADPNIELKGSVQNILKNKLTHIDESLQIALSKAGVEYQPQQAAPTETNNPIDRFLGFLTHGQSQLANLAGELEGMHLRNEQISPVSMIAIQVKVGYIQNEIEFFTNVLNKALESTKTIMNVQV